MQGRRATEEVRRTIGRLLVQEWSDTGLRIRNAWRIDRRAVEAIVASTHRQRDLIAGRYGDGRRPDLHIQLDGLAGRQWPHLVVRVIRLVRQAASGVELAVRGAKPALSHRRAWILRALKDHLAAIGSEHPQDEE